MPCKKIRIAGLRAERDYLAKRLQQVGERSILESSGLVIVEGDSGSGKTQLLTELMYQADKLKLRTLYGFGDPLDQTTPYLAWQTIFQMLFGLDQLFDDHSRLRSHVLSQLPPIEGERGYPAFAIRMSPLLNAVLPLNFPENRTTAQMGENAKQRTTHQFLLRLLERNTAGIGGGKPKPTLLVIEDGHWLDEFSWRLLVDVSQRVKPLLGIVATRRLSEQAMDDRTRRIYRMLDQSDKNIRWINLGYLSPADNLELLQQQLGIDSFPDDAFRILRRKTGGHPLFSLELARYWNATGQIQIKGNQCLMTGQLDELESAPVPNSTQQIITGRLERLSPSHQLLIKTASTLGKTFFVNDLVQIYPVSIDESLITEDLKILEEHKFIVPEDSAEKPSYRFDNEFIHEVALNLLPRQKKMQLAKRLLALKTEL